MPHYVDISPKIKAWTRFVAFDDGARAQVNNLASLDIVHKHIAIMPDVHLGKGATVGSVIPTKNAIIPSAVGVDIGCGMMAVRTTLTAHQLPDDLSSLRHAIEKAIPVGFGKWADKTLPDIALKTWQTKLRKEYQMILNRHPALGFNRKTGRRQINDVNHLGTLGGGNHFIEICLDDSHQVWLMLHSGSRGVGNCIGTYFIELAKTEMGRLLGTLPDEDLAYLSEGTQHFEDYFFAVNWAQTYARCNRDIMMQILTQVFTTQLQRPITTDLYAVNCHHNYVSNERHFNENLYITRKGAVSAKKDELGIIPGSMGAKSFIVRGLGNEESYCSCSHGAGRVMSRNQAKKQINLAEHRRATQDVECRKDKAVLDESPRAYKNIDDVMKSQQDLVEVLFTLKQILCVKG
ncbi:RtcB family protein [Legionella taurinensis]|uniref:3'-phosphate/5'-hydroxy nucleic acid ligase n=1 Tax=Legionella taurinensis TaxID=70611 RepID=A0A3A5L7W0_9GAMM|nr:RtcB family protein [Legionella taurinensis]RJT46203.1 RtcB family protein [Legionella taurinensis]RJT67081.1 RtcB family protein [Legionella taurinensis]STY26430.1 replication factor C subunit (activator I) [Legionella taurinensis]